MSYPSGRFRYRSALLLACSALGLAACGDSGSDGADSSPSAPAGESTSENAPKGKAVKFGYLAGVTGDYAPFTDAGLAAARVAQDEINAAGGINGRPLKLSVVDNKSSVEGAVTGFDRLVEVDKVAAIAIDNSDAGGAVLDAVRERKMPVFCAACGTDALNDIGDFMWRLTSSDDEGGLALAQYARDNDMDNIAMLVQQTEGPISTAESFAGYFEENIGGEICEDVRFDPGRSSYQAEVQKAWSCDPDAVYLSMGYEAAVPIIQEWQRRGLGGKLLLSPDLVNPDVAKVLENLEPGTAVGVGNGFDESSPAYKSFAERYEKETGNKPSEALWEPVFYDQWVILALAAAAAGEVNGPAIAANVAKVTNPEGTVVYSYADGIKALKEGKDIDYHGATGDDNLTEKGSLAAPTFNVLEAEKGDFVPTSSLTLDRSGLE